MKKEEEEKMERMKEGGEKEVECNVDERQWRRKQRYSERHRNRETVIVWMQPCTRCSAAVGQVMYLLIIKPAASR